MEKKVESIELKLFQIDCREVVGAIENYMVLEVLGSKKKMIKTSVYTIKELQNTTDYENSKWSKDKDGEIIYQIINYVKKIEDDLCIPENKHSKRKLFINSNQRQVTFKMMTKLLIIIQQSRK